MKPLFLFLLMAISYMTSAQQNDFCNRLDKLLLSFQNKDKSLWGEFIQGDPFTQSYKSRFSLAEGNSKNVIFYTVNDNENSFGYREELYVGADSVVGRKFFKTFQDKLEKCINFKLKESEVEVYDCKDLKFYSGSYVATVDFCNADAGKNVSVVFKLNRLSQ
jgi:hypothetical protein